MLALNVVNLSKSIDERYVLKNINFSIEQGDFVGLLGHNGSGKSTIIGIITGLMRKNSGTIKVFENDITTEPLKCKQSIGLVSQNYTFNQFDTVWQVVVNQAMLYGIKKNIAYERTEYYLKFLKLWSDRNLETRCLSGGMKKRMMLARALVNNPKLLIIDELTSCVDIEFRHLMYNLLIKLHNEGTTILMTTHYLEEIELLCNKVIVLSSGKVVAQHSVKELINNLPSSGFIFETNAIIDKHICDSLKLNHLGSNVYELTNNLSNVNITELIQRLSLSNIVVNNIREKNSRLEQYFLNLREKYSSE